MLINIYKYDPVVSLKPSTVVKLRSASDHRPAIMEQIFKIEITGIIKHFGLHSSEKKR